jgi:FkbM family methyltransferase
MLSRLARSVVGALPAGMLRRLGRVQFRVPILRRLSRRLVPRLIDGESTIRHGPARGLRIAAAGAHPGYAFGTSEPSLQQALVELLNPGDVFYDLGANVGFFTLLAARLVGPDGAVIAFEPDPRNAQALRSNIALNGLANVAVVEQGVSETSGSRRLVIAESTASHFSDGAADDETAVVVDVVSLDGFASDAAHRPPTVMKLDIEGEEVHALRGAAHLMARHRPAIICEVHGTEAEVSELLEAAGYRLRTLEAGEQPMPWNAHVLAVPG